MGQSENGNLEEVLQATGRLPQPNPPYVSGASQLDASIRLENPVGVRADHASSTQGALALLATLGFVGRLLWSFHRYLDFNFGGAFGVGTLDAPDAAGGAEPSSDWSDCRQISIK